MQRLLINALLSLLALAGLTLSMRLDLANLAVQQGRERLDAGDPIGAETAFARALALGDDAAPTVYNLGVSLYRNGKFSQAQQFFAAARTAADPDLSAASRYNHGNSQFRQAERLAASDPAAAQRFLREAMADYEAVLLESPGAADAASNLALARLRLSALESEAPDTRRRLAASDGEHERAAADAQRAKPDSESKKVSPGSDQQANAEALRQEADTAEASASAAKRRRDLTQNEVERLLSDARGREKPAGTPHVGNRRGQLAQPDKDW